MRIFRVIDNETGSEPDIPQIAATEGWAYGLMWCDMEGFALLEDGALLLLDECGNHRFCPQGRFEVRMVLSGLRFQRKGQCGMKEANK